MCSLSFLFVRNSSLPSLPLAKTAVFQPRLDTLGMVIYATEFVLWCGVFACSGYFNLMPWIRQKIMSRRREREIVSGDVIDATGASNDVSLQRAPSSTSVFRTPSSVTSDGLSMRSRTVERGEDI